MKATAKIEAYADSSGKTPDELEAMTKAELEAAANLSKPENRTLYNSLKHHRRNVEKAAMDAEMATLKGQITALLVDTFPNLVIKELRPEYSFQVIPNG